MFLELKGPKKYFPILIEQEYDSVQELTFLEKEDLKEDLEKMGIQSGSISKNVESNR